MYRLFCVALIVLVLPLSGCAKPTASEKAEREYVVLLKAGASAEEKCVKRRDIAAAYLSEENVDEYRSAKIKEALMCHYGADPPN